MLADGIVDVVISHAPEAEARALSQHPDWMYRKFAYNRFVVVGPPDDPARVRGTPDVVEAFRRIASSGSTFVSRGDASGTHEREQAIWTRAGTAPAAARLLVSGRGMALALRHADERRAYTLSDEATLWQFEHQLTLRVLLQGDERLLNTYAVVYPAGNATAAAFARWLTTGGGRAVVQQFVVAGRQAFVLWPAGCADDNPDAAVCP
jgi:tungstate transport system substrate-binding protein